MTPMAKDKPPESADSRIGLIGTSLWGGEEGRVRKGNAIKATKPKNTRVFLL